MFRRQKGSPNRFDEYENVVNHTECFGLHTHQISAQLITYRCGRMLTLRESMTRSTEADGVYAGVSSLISHLCVYIVNFSSAWISKVFWW